eukprot:TRINITY_DN21339_c0_g1_i1.p1 TRINITY_DN21339_c0_g1~~TRINITY_DN21339_c0_g1_i1.p1  ORF type:complete len:742 (+),score=162.51 TRINITY_DN21339_c0_g1_i1:117-2342(+)
MFRRSAKALSGAAFQSGGQGQFKNDRFPIEGPTGNSGRPDYAEKFRKGSRKSMRVKRPKPVVRTATQVLEMGYEEMHTALPHEFPEDNQKTDAAALRQAAMESTPVDQLVPVADEATRLAILEKARDGDYPEGIELETDPHRPQRRVFRTYQNFEVDHFPAAGQADFQADKLFTTYADPQVERESGEVQLTIPTQASECPGQHRMKRFKTHKFFWGTNGWHNYGHRPIYAQSPSSFAGSNYWSTHNRDRFQWKDLMATTWDMLLDEPTNPLLRAPHGAWESLPLDGETIAPDVMRDNEAIGAKDTVVEDFEGGQHVITTQANSDMDVLPVSILPSPGKWSKQLGMPMVKTIGPIQHEHEMHLPEKLHRAEKRLRLSPDPEREGQGMRILCVGDSLTLGASYGTDEYLHTKGPYSMAQEREEKELHEWPYAKRLHELTNAEIDIVARFRDTTEDMRDRLWRTVTAAHRRGEPYDLVVIWGGIWDLFNPDVSADQVAQNLMKMHHVCHMHGMKTVSLALPQTHGSIWKMMGPRVVDVNAKMEQFTRDRRKDMVGVDVFNLVANRVTPLAVERHSTGSHEYAAARRKVGPVFRSGMIEFSPLGYDRVGELVFKELKHRPGFLRKALPNRFSGTPCADPHPTEYALREMREAHYEHHASRRRAMATPDLYGSTAEDHMSKFKDEKHEPDYISEDQRQRHNMARAHERRITVSTHTARRNHLKTDQATMSVGKLEYVTEHRVSKIL